VALRSRTQQQQAGASAVDVVAYLAILAPGPGSLRSVYQAMRSNGEVRYVGITNSLRRRFSEHFAGSRFTIQGIQGLHGLSLADAKAVEQVLIENYGLGKNGGTLTNKINSIAKTNPAYAQALVRGKKILQGIGYPGF